MWSSSNPARALRAVAAALAVIVAAIVAAGCGFQLRGEFQYPFSTIYVNAPDGSPIALALRHTLEGAGGARILDGAAAAQVILEVPPPVEDKSVLSLSGAGRVREFLLTYRVTYRLHDASGRDWLPRSEITLRRSFTFAETEVLAREYQEVRLFREMQADAVQQIARRLQMAKPPS
jgi:LPS-assembly lipoprotein